MNAETWALAACQETDPAIFTFPQDGGEGYRNFEEARKLCGSCPIRFDCLEDALSAPPTWVHEDIDSGHMQITAGYSMFQAGLTPAELSTLAQKRMAS